MRLTDVTDPFVTLPCKIGRRDSMLFRKLSGYPNQSNRRELLVGNSNRVDERQPVIGSMHSGTERTGLYTCAASMRRCKSVGIIYKSTKSWRRTYLLKSYMSIPRQAIDRSVLVPASK